jgi:RNA polymerase sigma-70 factor (ECF subfamily)
MHSSDHEHEKLLIHRLQKGDEKAFESLYNLYWEKLVVIAYHRVGSLETAKELVQDVFTNLWRRREHLEVRTTFAAYIQTALKYTILDHIRSLKVKDKYVESIKNSKTDSDNATLELIAYHELDRFLEHEISKLPEKCQQIFRLSRVDQLSIREIAEQLQISPKTVENQISKALKVLRSSIQEFTTCLLLIIFSY